MEWLAESVETVVAALCLVIELDQFLSVHLF
jgi:hypothetical protein